jgi:hypothetical protein
MATVNSRLHLASRQAKQSTFAVVVTDNVPSGRPKIVAVTSAPGPILDCLAARPGRSVLAIDFETDPLFMPTAGGKTGPLYAIVPFEACGAEASLVEFLASEPGLILTNHNSPDELRAVAVPASWSVLG